MKKLLILNDTSLGDLHFGCQRVMKVLMAGLADAGISVVGSVPVGVDWKSFDNIDDLIAQSDIILVNGEGTIHGGRKKAENLLSISEIVPKSKALVLINCLYENNPESWVRYLRRFDLIVARDSASAAEFSCLLGRHVDFMPDLSMCGVYQAIGERVRGRGVLIGDSVSWSSTKKLLELAEKRKILGDEVLLSPLSPVFKPEIQIRKFLPKEISKNLIRWWGDSFRKRHSVMKFVVSDVEYLDLLSIYRAHLTGRFHSTCFSLITRTPFLALSSNSSKIERLLLDAGLSSNRIIRRGGFSSDFDLLSIPDFSNEELSAVDRYLEVGRSKFLELMHTLSRF